MSITIPKSKVEPQDKPVPMKVRPQRPAPGASPSVEFAKVLERQKSAGRIVPGRENNAPNGVGISKGGAAPTGRNLDTGFAVNPARNNAPGPLDATVASTLLRLNALTVQKVGAATPPASETLHRSLAPLARMVALRSASSPGASLQCPKGLGSLSSRFESGEAGVAAIGYDRQGGTSYGRYQISSRVGTMSEFVAFLEERAPEWAKRLKAAGPADTGGKDGAMPLEWRRIAAEDPDRFDALQRDFIERTHYLPAAAEIREKTGIDIQRQSRALQEVLWSTAVQHGARGAARLFCKVMAQEEGSVRSGIRVHKMIEGIYEERADQFGGSTSQVQAAVRRRFQEERKLALGMLEAESRRGRITA